MGSVPAADRQPAPRRGDRSPRVFDAATRRVGDGAQRAERVDRARARTARAAQEMTGSTMTHISAIGTARSGIKRNVPKNHTMTMANHESETADAAIQPASAQHGANSAM